MFKLSRTAVSEYFPTSAILQLILWSNGCVWLTVQSTRRREMIYSLLRVCSTSRQLDLYYRSGLMKVSSRHVRSVSYSLYAVKGAFPSSLVFTELMVAQTSYCRAQTRRRVAVVDTHGDSKPAVVSQSSMHISSVSRGSYSVSGDWWNLSCIVIFRMDNTEPVCQFRRSWRFNF